MRYERIFMWSIILLLFLHVSVSIFAVDIGSDTAVNRFNTQQQLNDGDRVAGFAALDAGFLIAGVGQTAQWDTFFAVSGSLDFNLGTLRLTQDLIVQNVSTLTELGNIIGNGHIFLFSPSMDCVPTFTDAVTFGDLQLVFNGNSTFNGDSFALTFTGECSINGRGNIISFAPTFTIEVEANSSLMFRDVTLKGISDGKIALFDHTSTISFQDVELVLDGDFTFNTGHFEVFNNLKIVGDGHTFIYQSPEVSTIRARDPQAISNSLCQPGFCGSLILDHGVTFRYDPTEPDLLVLENQNASIIMNSASLIATNSLQLTRGHLNIDGRSTLENIVFGDGTTSNNLCVEILPAANVEITGGNLIYSNV